MAVWIGVIFLVLSGHLLPALTLAFIAILLGE